MGKSSRSSEESWAASDLLGSMMRVGRCTCSIIQAMVAVFPEPVMPWRVWYASPRFTPVVSAVMAVGWSPEGLKGETTSKSGMTNRG